MPLANLSEATTDLPAPNAVEFYGNREWLEGSLGLPLASLPKFMLNRRFKGLKVGRPTRRLLQPEKFLRHATGDIIGLSVWRKRTNFA